MRKLALCGVAIAALGISLIGGTAAAEAPVHLPIGNLEVTFDGGFSPRALPRKAASPVTAALDGTFATLDGSPPPALAELAVEADRNLSLDAKGIPSCPVLQLRQSTPRLESSCSGAVLGRGEAGIEIHFPESEPISIRSPLVIVKGGEREGVTTLYVRAYLTVPTPSVLVVKVKVSKVRDGRYGLRAVASVPKIAGGDGSVTSFKLKIGKRFTYQGEKRSLLSARCTDGKLRLQASASFVDGSVAPGAVSQICEQRG